MVIAIIGILVALLLPAVQTARESARRTQCSNNLRQIGLGLHAFHDTDGRLPPGLHTDPAIDETRPGLGWVTRILPQLEQTAIFDQITAFRGGPGAMIGNPWEYFVDPGNVDPFLAARLNVDFPFVPGSTSSIESLVCPSSDLPDFVPFDTAISTRLQGLATTSYKGSSGPSRRGVFVRPNQVADGNSSDANRTFNLSDGGGGLTLPQLIRSTRISFNQIPDGLSNTIGVAEAASAVEASNNRQMWPVWIGDPTDRGFDETVIFKTEFFPNCQLGGARELWSFNDPEVQSVQQTLEDFGDARGRTDVNDCSYSWHPGIVLHMFMDGSVHSLSENIEVRAYILAGDRSDGLFNVGLEL